MNESNLKNKNLDDENKKLKDIILNKENEIKKMKDEVNKCKLDKDSNNKNLKEEIMKNRQHEKIIDKLKKEKKK